jgi:hypothetical protein
MPPGCGIATELSDIAELSRMEYVYAINHEYDVSLELYTRGFSRYKSIPLFINKIIDVSRPVHFHQAPIPTMPFDVIKLASFTFAITNARLSNTSLITARQSTAVSMAQDTDMPLD